MADALIITLVAEGALSPGDASAASDVVRGIGAEIVAQSWLEAGDAYDILARGDAPNIRAALEDALPAVDVVVQSGATPRRKKLIVADMDSTMIACECIDELADYAGLKAEVAAITEAAMRGELDFAGALKARVALLKGLPVATLDQCREERVRLNPGARQLVQTMTANGARSLLVSGGFMPFAVPVAREIGFARVLANRLDVAKDGDVDVLAGTVPEPIVDAAAKKALLEADGTPMSAALAVGDGANDIPMIQAAMAGGGLGIAYQAKPKAAAAAQAHVRHGDLTVLLRAQGYRRAEWVD
ncbi:phosphoserine phosphatase SerB [Sandarakinorhabdus limnophila]|jgi:phosphoserine phosphatase|uniref:phosphoserine phosphatase SerB n=1 Tax=Sandarakinorhabdus limnophila TaxID=210512 RepID=UPI0026F2A0FC|nr:phosphoserine phosphatase SerB [Sandarakinorhabdus limnophila]